MRTPPRARLELCLSSTSACAWQLKQFLTFPQQGLHHCHEGKKQGHILGGRVGISDPREGKLTSLPLTPGSRREAGPRGAQGRKEHRARSCPSAGRRMREAMQIAGWHLSPRTFWGFQSEQWVALTQLLGGTVPFSVWAQSCQM